MNVFQVNACRVPGEDIIDQFGFSPDSIALALISLFSYFIIFLFLLWIIHQPKILHFLHSYQWIKKLIHIPNDPQQKKPNNHENWGEIPRANVAILPQTVLEWREISYVTGKKKKCLLSRISGSLKSGEMLAIMGGSGES